MTRINTTEANAPRLGVYTTPAARMAPLADELIANSTQAVHALVQHIIARKGRVYAQTLISHLAKEANE